MWSASQEKSRNSGRNVFQSIIIPIGLAFRFPRLSASHALPRLAFSSSSFLKKQTNEQTKHCFTPKLWSVKKMRGRLHRSQNREGKKWTLVNDFHSECSGGLQGSGDSSAERGRIQNHLSWERHSVKEDRKAAWGEGEAPPTKVAVKLAGLEVVVRIVRSRSSSHQSNLLHPSFSVYILIGL